MKQRISVEDLKQLTPSQQEKLRAWWKPRDGNWFIRNGDTYNHLLVSIKDNLLFDTQNNGYAKENCLPLLSIGQCIELIREKYDGRKSTGDFGYYLRYDFSRVINVDEPIDTLWEAVKSIL